MTKPIPANPWQANLPAELPLYFRRNIEPGEGGCWLWKRSKDKDGYGWSSFENKTHQAHRLSYQLVNGEIPDGLHLDHLCRVRHCVNPDHLEPVTPRENLRRGDTTTAWERCQRCGSEYSIIGVAKPQRRCLSCKEKYDAEHRSEKAQSGMARRKPEDISVGKENAS